MSDPFAPVVAALARYSFTTHDERSLYLSLEEALTAGGVVYLREHVLGPRSRVDFYVPATCLAIEVKVQGNPGPILRQLTRYGEHESVTAILLVTTLAKLARIPESISGKPARAYRVAGPFG